MDEMHEDNRRINISVFPKFDWDFPFIPHLYNLINSKIELSVAEVCCLTQQRSYSCHFMTAVKGLAPLEVRLGLPFDVLHVESGT